MSDEEFLQSFEICTLPKTEWTHCAHIRMGWIYLNRYPFEEALAKARAGIQKYNSAVGSKGYRETITQFYMRMIAYRLANSEESAPFEGFLADNSDLYRNENPVRKLHYSDPIWLSEKAKTEFLQPDLAPLPQLQG